MISFSMRVVSHDDTDTDDAMVVAGYVSLVEKLEAVKDGSVVLVDEGRLKVSVPDRVLHAVYWNEPPCPIVRWYDPK
jgi:hypothetical protein